MKIESIVVGPLLTNCYIVHDEQECIIVDPGGDPESIIKFIQERKLNPKFILATHCHFDHILSAGEIKTFFKVPFYINEKDMETLEEFSDSISDYLGIDNLEPPEPDGTFKEGDIFHVGKSEIRVIDTPGHTGGSSSFVSGDSIITGDFVFAGSIGRMDLGGSRDDMIRSLTSFRKMDRNFKLYPGHGNTTDLETEKEKNPFLRNFELI